MDYIAIGKIGAPWGLQGDVKFKIYNAESEVLNKTRLVYYKTGFSFKILKIVQLRFQDKLCLMRFENYSSPESLKALQGLELFVPLNQLPPKKKGEFYIHELIGMKVLDESGKELGVVKSVENYGSTDLLDVGLDSLIPWMPEVIVSVDEIGKVIVIKPLEGLLD